MGTQRLLGVLLASMSLLQASQIEALALGRLQVISAQQEPMLVELSLAETEGVLAAAVQPRLASRGEYQVAGITYEDWFDAMQLQVVNREQQLLVQISSAEIVTQENLDLLIEVDYMGGRLLGQFTPEFQQSKSKQPEATPNKVEPVIQQTTNEAVIEDPAEVIIEAITAASIQAVPTSNETPIAPVIEQAIEEPMINATPTITVTAGQTLWRVAVDNAPQGISPWQSLMAIYKANPKAFKNGRITQLMAASKVSIPATDAMLTLTAKQAKVAYEQIIASYKAATVAPVKLAEKPKLKTVDQPLVKQQPEEADVAATALQTQQLAEKRAKQEAQLQAMNATLAKLEGQSQSLQEQLEELETQRNQAANEAQQLQSKKQELAQGLQSQQLSLQTLAQNKELLKQDLTSLGQQVDVTELELLDKQKQLSDLGEEVNALQQEKLSIASMPAQSDAQTSALPESGVVPASEASEMTSTAISKQLYPWFMGGLLVLMLGLIFSLLWRWVNRKSVPKVVAQEPPIDDAPAQVVLDPLADHDAKPSAHSQHLHEVSERMELNEQVASSEAGFIEQLLQEQANQGVQPQADTLHLSAEVEALLQQQRSAQQMANEPHSTGTSEEDVLGKLDLARSYKKMGHIEEAQALLQEVLHAGNLEQQTEATLLLSRMRQD